MTTQTITFRKPMNYRDYAELPDEVRCEVIEGEVWMSPAPEPDHQFTCGNLLFAIMAWLREHKGVGVALTAPVDVILQDDDEQVTVFQPDLVFVAEANRQRITRRGIEGPPDLVIEISSLSTRERDRQTKRAVYAQHGVPEYWIVDRETQTVEILRRHGKGYRRAQVAKGDEQLTTPLLPDFSLRVAAIFATP
ncbi:MAG: Uma2 family endonuclease [Planctomycetota bacterium]